MCDECFFINYSVLLREAAKKGFSLTELFTVDKPFPPKKKDLNGRAIKALPPPPSLMVVGTFISSSSKSKKKMFFP